MSCGNLKNLEVKNNYTKTIFRNQVQVNCIASSHYIMTYIMHNKTKH